MRIQIKAPWREEKEEAEKDREYFVSQFGEVHAGMEGVTLTEGVEWRATHEIELDEYNIERVE